MEKRGGRRRGKDESFEVAADPTAITTARITTRRSSMNSENATSGRTSRGSITTEKTATRTSARNRSKLVASAAPAVPPTVPESPVKEVDESTRPKINPATAISSNLPAKTAKVSLNAGTVRIIPVAVEQRSNDEGRNSVSRQSTVSGGTVDLTPAVNDAAVRNEANARLTDYIRRSASNTLANVAEAVRRSVSRQPSPSATATDSHYSHSYYDEEEEYSDNEDNPNFVSNNSEYLSILEQEFLCRPKEIPREFGGPWGIAIILIVLPLLVTYIVSSTFFTGSENTLEEFMLKSKNNSVDLLQQIFPEDVVIAFLCFHMGTLLLSGSLFGLVVRLPRMNHALEFKFNALPMAICMNLIWIAATYYNNFNIADYVLENQWRFFIYGLIYAFITAMWAHVRAVYYPSDNSQINIYGKTDNIIVDFAMGRNLSPQWLNLVDLKQYCYRTQLMITLLIAECYMIKCLPTLTIENWREFNSETFWQNTNWNSGTLLAAGMLIYYVADAIIFEHHLASSFELQYEGFGALLLLRYAATPFLLSGILRNCHLNNVNLDWFGSFDIAISLLLFIFGIIWKRLSSATKYKYRLNPTHNYFDNVDTIHTFQGRRLMVDKFWGTMRQPNYAGDIMALACLCLPFTFTVLWQAHLGIMLIIIMLVHRSTRVNKRNYQRYYSSWVRYCNIVPYYILPKIF